MRYKIVVHKEGKPDETRIVEGTSHFEVYTNIRNEGGAVVQLTELAPGISALSRLMNITIGTGVKTEERINFAKNLAAMLSAGLTLSRALSVIERQTHNKALKKVISGLEDDVKTGSSFHESLAKHPKIFPRLFVAMTKAGEESGKIADSLHVVSRQMERSYLLGKKVKGAMIYPTIIMVAIVIIAVLLLMYVVPTLSATFKSLNVPLPTMTRVIVSISDFVSHQGLLTFGLLAGIFGGIYAFAKSKKGAALILVVSLRIPVIGDLVRETFAARASRTLSSLLSSGVEMLTAIEITGEVVDDNIFGAVVREASVRVKKGESLSTVFVEQSKLFPFFVGDMITVGEETGKVAEMLGQVAEYYEADVEERTKDLSTIIEPLLMLFIGVAVGIFAIAMVAPIYSLSSKI